jgi:uncharacterized membrane protein
MTNPTSPVSLAETRSWIYWFVDGLPQLLIGVSALLFGFYFISTGTPSGGTTASVLALGAFLIYLLLTVRAAQILEWLKARITYPRTGYAASPYFAAADNFARSPSLKLTPFQDPNAPAIAEIKRAREARSLRLSRTYLLLAFTSLAIWFIHIPWICALTGLLMGLILWIGTRIDNSVSLLVVLGFPVVGICVDTLQSDPHARVGYFILGVGFLFLLEGLISLLLYLRRHPAPQA